MDSTELACGFAEGLAFQAKGSNDSESVRLSFNLVAYREVTIMILVLVTHVPFTSSLKQKVFTPLELVRSFQWSAGFGGATS